VYFKYFLIVNTLFKKVFVFAAFKSLDPNPGGGRVNYHLAYHKATAHTRPFRILLAISLKKNSIQNDWPHRFITTASHIATRVTKDQLDSNWITGTGPLPITCQAE